MMHVRKGVPPGTEAERTEAFPALLITVDEAAFYLGIGRTAVYDLVRRKKLKSVKINRSRRIVMRSVIEYVKQLEADTDDGDLAS